MATENICIICALVIISAHLDLPAGYSVFVLVDVSMDTVADANSQHEFYVTRNGI